MLSLGAAIKSFTILGLNSLEWTGLAVTTFIIFYFGTELFHVIYNTWVGQILGMNTDLKKMGRWAGDLYIFFVYYPISYADKLVVILR